MHTGAVLGQPLASQLHYQTVSSYLVFLPFCLCPHISFSPVIKMTFKSNHVTSCLRPFRSLSSDPRIISFQVPSWSGPCSHLQPPFHFSSHLFCLCTYCFLFPERFPPSHLHPILAKSESALSPQPTHLPSLASVTTSSPPHPLPLAGCGVLLFNLINPTIPIPLPAWHL